MNKKTLKDLNFANKKVIVRFDFNVPLKNGEITDDTRIKAALATIKYLQEHNAKIIMLSHLGRVRNIEDKEKYSLAVVAKKLQALTNYPVTFINETRGTKLENAIANLKAKDLLLIENTRFEDINQQKESKNDPELGKYWASLADIFVNDAFGTAHRTHASNVGIATYIADSCIGFLIEKELLMLNKITLNPERPYVAVLGGAKVSDKINVIKELLTKADTVIIGGAMAYTFMKALGYTIGNSLVENDKIDLAKTLITENKNKLVLPEDYLSAKTFKDEPGINTKDQNIPDHEIGLDIGQKSINLFKSHLQSAKTIFWNGPMGVFEFKNFAHGTESICQTIANLKNAFTLIGGGDSAAAVTKFNYQNQVSFISTGGGASLEYIEGKKLPGIEAIKNK